MEGTRVLRIIQICMIVYVLILFCFLHIFPVASGQSAMTPVKWIITFLALYCAFAGFSLQKRFLRMPANSRPDSKSTPISRWKVGNILRLAFATSVSLYGLLLHFLGGPDSLAFALNGLGLVLLLWWKPGIPRLQEQ